MQSSATPSLSESAPERVRSGSGAGPERIRSGSGAVPEWIRGGSGYSESSHTAYARASLFRFRAVSLMFAVVSHEEW
jgi:hypothetical protein